jgi:hypothetical protein
VSTDDEKEVHAAVGTSSTTGANPRSSPAFQVRMALFSKNVRAVSRFTSVFDQVHSALLQAPEDFVEYEFF